MSHPEDRNRRPRRKGLQEQLHLAAAALLTVFGALMGVQSRGDALDRCGTSSNELPGTLDGALLDVAAADGAPGMIRPDHHFGARLTGGVTAHCADGDEHAIHTVSTQVRDRSKPVHLRLRRGFLRTVPPARRLDRHDPGAVRSQSPNRRLRESPGCPVRRRHWLDRRLLPPGAAPPGR